MTIKISFLRDCALMFFAALGLGKVVDDVFMRMNWAAGPNNLYYSAFVLAAIMLWLKYSGRKDSTA